MGKSIVFTVTTDLTHDQRMRRIAGTLSQAGYAVTLVGRELPSSVPLAVTSYKQVRLAAFFLKGPFFYLEYNVRLILWFLGNKFDLYGTIDADTALAGIFTTWWRRKPLVYDAHELFPEMPEVVQRLWVQKVWRFIERWAFQSATLSYTVSASLVQYFQETYHKKVELIRNMPLRQEALPTPQNPPFFIYQGALNVGRGLENTIAAMQQVPAQLIICGTGPLRESLERQVRTLGLEKKVLFKGNLAPEPLSQLTAAAWAGIMLLDNQGLSYYYSLANKFFDYVQAGIPQVCVPFPEYVHLNAQHEVALMVPPEVEKIQEALLTLLQYPALYQKLQQNSILARQEWSWETETQRLLELYNKI